MVFRPSGGGATGSSSACAAMSLAVSARRRASGSIIENPFEAAAEPRESAGPDLCRVSLVLVDHGRDLGGSQAPSRHFGHGGVVVGRCLKAVVNTARRGVIDVRR